jgi:hypothetical protein
LTIFREVQLGTNGKLKVVIVLQGAGCDNQITNLDFRGDRARRACANDKIKFCVV